MNFCLGTFRVLLVLLQAQQLHKHPLLLRERSFNIVVQRLITGLLADVGHLWPKLLIISAFSDSQTPVCKYQPEILL